MYCFPQNETPLFANPLAQLSQLTIQIHSAALDLTSYESFFGAENTGFVLEGAQSMMVALQDILRSSEPETLLGGREIRHDFRNKLAVVKGFSDLMKMDLPESHSSLMLLHRLTERCTRFSTLLDSFATTGLAQTYRMAS